MTTGTMIMFVRANAELAQACVELIAEKVDLEKTLDLIRGCDLRAQEYWREKTGNELVSPDRTELIKFLMDKVVESELIIEEKRNEIGRLHLEIKHLKDVMTPEQVEQEQAWINQK